MRVRWDESNRRWEASVGSGKRRRWLRSRVPGEQGREIVEAKLRMILDGPEPVAPGTLAEFIEVSWWPVVLAKKAKSTIREYKRTLDGPLADIQAMPLNQITVTELQALVFSLSRTLHPKTVNNYFRVLSSILEYATKLGRYSGGHHRLVVLPDVPEFEGRAISQEEADRLLESARRLRPELEGPIWAAFNLGLRKNEAMGLKRSQIKLLSDRAEVHLQDNRQPHGEEARLKGRKAGSKRVLTIPRNWGEKLLSFGEDGQIYLFNYLGKPVYANRVTRHMPELAADAGIGPVRFHDLRHSCATNLRAAGVPETVIQKGILGHASLEMTAHYLANKGDSVLDAFSRITSNG